MTLRTAPLQEKPYDRFHSTCNSTIFSTFKFDKSDKQCSKSSEVPIYVSYLVLVLGKSGISEVDAFPVTFQASNTFRMAEPSVGSSRTLIDNTDEWEYEYHPTEKEEHFPEHQFVDNRTKFCRYFT